MPPPWPGWASSSRPASWPTPTQGYGARPAPDRDIWVLTHPDLKDTPRVSALLRHLVAAISAQRDLIEGRRPAP